MHFGRRLTSYQLLIAVALFLALSANATFFQNILQIYPLQDNTGFLLSVFVLLFSALLFMLSLFSLIIPSKYVAILFIGVAAFSAYFSDQYGTVIDVEMIRNMIETDTSETADLITWGLISRVLLLALLPTIIVFRLRLQKVKLRRYLAVHAIVTGMSLCVAAACVFSFSSQYASFFREHKSVRYYVTPAYPIYSALQFAGSFSHIDTDLPFKSFDAISSILEDETDHKELIILVVGETARADHFSLNGYSRNTNPLLSQESRLISYSRIQSCGTSTAISVPCMFSYSGHDGFDVKSARNTENGLDLLQKAGVNVLWRDNNSDSKGVADRIPFENYRTADKNPICNPECRDEGMLDGLQTYINDQTGDILIVLHQMGSHGPAYFQRYPPEFERFTPACQSAELSDCSQEEIINAYDNTIVYTDYFLSKVIDFLKVNTPKYETAMFYVSDHGESLGESGIYLHGMPYRFAPDAQTHVPVIAWIGESSDIDYEKSKRLKDLDNTHDEVFDTLLTVFEVNTNLLPSAKDKLIVLSEEDE